MSRPPASGPIATAAPVVAPQIPNAVPRSLPLKALARSASEVANIIAAPIPWAARDRFSTNGSPARPDASEATENTPRPMVNTSRRPMRSASEPAVNRNAASVSAYASTTHCRSEKLECSDVWIDGSATLTIVTSSSSMKIATQTTDSVHQRLGSLPPCAGAGPALMGGTLASAQVTSATAPATMNASAQARSVLIQAPRSTFRPSRR